MLEGYFSNKRTNIFSKERLNEHFWVHFIGLINVLLKISYFERTLIRKNKKNKKILKERNSKEKNYFWKNVTRSNDLVPAWLLAILKSIYSWNLNMYQIFILFYNFIGTCSFLITDKRDKRENGRDALKKIREWLCS